jgi:two-component system sensor histidine kinase FlrB
MSKRFVTPFESRVRLTLLGVLLAALLLQGGTILVLHQSRQATEAEMLSPLLESLDRMEVNGSARHPTWQNVSTERLGREVRTRFFLRDTIGATVRAAWLRIPSNARARLLSGTSAQVKRTDDEGVEWNLYRVVQVGAKAQIISAGRQFPEYARLEALERWHNTGQIVALTLLLAAVLLATREVVRPFQKLQRVARQAQQNLDVEDRPGREEWDEIIETFQATIRRLEENEARLADQFQHSEQARLQLEDFSTRIIDAIPSAIIATDSNAQIVRCNPAAEGLPGLMHPEHGSSLSQWLGSGAPWRDILDAPEVTEGEIEGTSDDEPFHFGYQKLPLQDGGSLWLLHDRTNLRRLETLLKQRARLAALGETAAGLAHELRNAMAAIVGYARLSGRASGQEASEIAARIESEAAAMEEMLNRFLEVARPTEPRRVATCAEDIVRETLDHYEQRFVECRITLVRKLDSDTVVPIDPFWLRQSLVNLLENTLAHVPAQGHVWVESGRTDHFWKLSIADDGSGIPPELRERVLAPFVSMRPGGTGLGLALVQKVATAHDGRVEVGETAGGGARFDLYFSLQVTDTAAVHQS